MNIILNAYKRNRYTVIYFVCVSAKFGTSTVLIVNGTLIEAKMFTFTLESTHFIFNKSPIYTHDGASAKFNTNSRNGLQCTFCTSAAHFFL